MSLLEKLVVLLQHYGARGVDIVAVDPLEVEGPDEPTEQFVEVFRWLREVASRDGRDGLADKAIARLRSRPPLPGLGFVDWERAFPGAWAFSCYEQQLFAELGRTVWVNDSATFFGRLEGIRPGWCFITPGADEPPPGTPVDRFLQRITNAVKVPSRIVSSLPATQEQKKQEVPESSLAEVRRVREALALQYGFSRPKKPQPETQERDAAELVEVSP